MNAEERAFRAGYEDGWDDCKFDVFRPDESVLIWKRDEIARRDAEEDKQNKGMLGL